MYAQNTSPYKYSLQSKAKNTGDRTTSAHFNDFKETIRQLNNCSKMQTQLHFFESNILSYLPFTGGGLNPDINNLIGSNHVALITPLA